MMPVVRDLCCILWELRVRAFGLVLLRPSY
jgi:hypothetical protein